MYDPVYTVLKNIPLKTLASSLTDSSLIYFDSWSWWQQNSCPGNKWNHEQASHATGRADFVLGQLFISLVFWHLLHNCPLYASIVSSQYISLWHMWLCRATDGDLCACSAAGRSKGCLTGELLDFRALKGVQATQQDRVSPWVVIAVLWYHN